MTGFSWARRCCWGERGRRGERGAGDLRCSGRLQTWRRASCAGEFLRESKNMPKVTTSNFPTCHYVTHKNSDLPSTIFSRRPISFFSRFHSPAIQWAREKTMTARRTLASARSSQSLAHPPASLLSSV